MGYIFLEIEGFSSSSNQPQTKTIERIYIASRQLFKTRYKKNSKIGTLEKSYPFSMIETINVRSIVYVDHTILKLPILYSVRLIVEIGLTWFGRIDFDLKR